MAQQPESLPTVRSGQFDALRSRFVEGLPARLREILGASGGPEVCAALHRMAGAAGSFGFPEIGDTARWAERALASNDPMESQKALASLGDLVRATVKQTEAGRVEPLA